MSVAKTRHSAIWRLSVVARTGHLAGLSKGLARYSLDAGLTGWGGRIRTGEFQRFRPPVRGFLASPKMIRTC